MTPFEHFFIRENWSAFHAALDQTYTHFQSLNTTTPSVFANQNVLDVVHKRVAFLDDLLTQQALHLADLNEELRRNRNTITSLLSLFEDEDTIENLSSERMQQITQDCSDNFETMLRTVVSQTHKAQAKAADKVEEERDADDTVKTQDIYERLGEFDVPNLPPDASFDSFKDAMKTVLGKMRDDDATREKTEAVILTPQQRLFLEIQREVGKTITNFGSALRKIDITETIQFANGTLALQGHFNRKALLDVAHSLVQIGNLRLSAKVSDNMVPTLFLHQQRFAVFRFPRKATEQALNTRLDAIADRARTVDRVSPLEKPLRHKLFPRALFVWLPDASLVSALDIKPTIKAELPL